MRYYPLFLDLTDKEVLVVGAGAVGRRKLATLATVPLRGITVIDPAGLDLAPMHALDEDFPASVAVKGPGDKNFTLTAKNQTQDSAFLTPEAYFSTLNADSFTLAPESLRLEENACRLTILERAFQPQDLEGKSLVFAATADAAVNTAIAALCAAQNIWCNNASGPEDSDFFVPALAHTGDLTVAIGTGGKSPALARKLRKDLEAWLGNRYTPFLRVMGRLRPRLLALELPTPTNTTLLRALTDSPLAGYLEEKDRPGARRLLESLLPEQLHPGIEELLYDL